MSPSSTPLLLLKTRSTPTDPYATHFSSPSSPFTPTFIPVLEHTPNKPNLARIKTLLRERSLQEGYGGCIFTSQRAVEGWARVVGEVDKEEEGDDESMVSPLCFVLQYSFRLSWVHSFCVSCSKLTNTQTR